MVDYVMWRQLTRTDYDSMHGLAAPSGSGGGARHIALGRATPTFPIDQFLNVGNRTEVAIAVDSDGHGPGHVKFTSIPGRRGGEWIIADQHTHRHPAWTSAAGLPTAYNPLNKPVILVFRVGNKFHARLSDTNFLTRFRPELSIGYSTKGIAPVTPAMLTAFNVEPKYLLTSFEEYVATEPLSPFDPANIEDGRHKLFAAITMRQGQSRFRDSLLMEYSKRCAVTGTDVLWVLEAAHIVPYQGRKTNVLQNGLLLRADIHTLFDLGLISIKPHNRLIMVSSLLEGSVYEKLHEKAIRPSRSTKAQPSTEALEYHYSRFRR